MKTMRNTIIAIPLFIGQRRSPPSSMGAGAVTCLDFPCAAGIPLGLS